MANEIILPSGYSSDFAHLHAKRKAEPITETDYCPVEGSQAQKPAPAPCPVKEEYFLQLRSRSMYRPTWWERNFGTVLGLCLVALGVIIIGVLTPLVMADAKKNRENAADWGYRAGAAGIPVDACPYGDASLAFIWKQAWAEAKAQTK